MGRSPRIKGTPRGPSLPNAPMFLGLIQKHFRVERDFN